MTRQMVMNMLGNSCSQQRKILSNMQISAKVEINFDHVEQPILKNVYVTN